MPLCLLYLEFSLLLLLFNFSLSNVCSGFYNGRVSLFFGSSIEAPFFFRSHTKYYSERWLSCAKKYRFITFILTQDLCENQENQEDDNGDYDHTSSSSLFRSINLQQSPYCTSIHTSGVSLSVVVVVVGVGGGGACLEHTDTDSGHR